MDVITSPNSDFILTGLATGSCHLNIATLRLQIRKVVSMLDSDKKSKLKKHKQVMDKLAQRLTSFEEYNKGVTKKGQPLGVMAQHGAKSSEMMQKSEEGAKTQIKLDNKITMKMLQAKQKEIKQKAKKLKNAAGSVVVEEETAENLGGLFGDSEPA